MRTAETRFLEPTHLISRRQITSSARNNYRPTGARWLVRVRLNGKPQPRPFAGKSAFTREADLPA